MMRLLLLVLGLCFTFSISTEAQILLQIERTGSPKTQKLDAGTYLEYRLYEYDEWQSGYIEQLIPSENIVVMNDRHLRLDQIRSLRFDSPQRWSRPLGRNVMLFGVGWSLYSGIAALVYEEETYSWGDAAVTGTAVATGFLIQRIFRFKKYHFDKRNRLRIVDMRLED